MKYTTLALLTLLSSIVNLQAQQLVELCQDDKVAAVISQMNAPCAFKVDRKQEKESALSPKDDLHRKLSAGEQLQCSNRSDKRAKKKDEACLTIYLCGSRQDKQVKTISPKWFSVVNVPDVLPRGESRPGSQASLGVSDFLLLAVGQTPVGYESAKVFRPENPETDRVHPKIGFVELVGLERDLTYANKARDAGMLTEALTYYQRVIQLNPADSRAILGMGNIYADQGRWEEAEESYRKAIKSNPLLATAYSALTYVLLQRSRGGGSLTVTDAEAAALEAVRLQPTNAIAYDLLGLTLEMQGHSLDQAEEAYRSAVELKPNFVIARLHLSRLLRTLGRHTEAESHYARALTLAADTDTLLLMAEKLQSEGQFRTSEGPLRRLLRTEPENSLALYLLSKALVYRKEYAKAEGLLKRPVTGKIAQFEVQRLLAFTYLRMDRPEDAEKAFGLAATVASPDQRKLLIGMTGLSGLAEHYLSNQRPKDAVRVYESALAFDPENAQLKSRLALASASDKKP